MNNNIIESCKKYMLLEVDSLSYQRNINNTEKDLQKCEIKSNVNDVNKSSYKSTNRISKEFNNEDKLFWCFLIILKGEQDYILDHSFKKEKEFKIETIEKLRKIKAELKALKLKLNDIENELLNEKKITLKGLVALCLLYKINIMYVWNRKYFEIINNADDKINIIINENGEDKISNDVSNNKMNYYRENYWCIENISKPLKAITAYSKDELLIIIKKLEINDINLKKTKKEMYEKILNLAS